MRLLRLLFFIIILLLSYTAQQIFDDRSLPQALSASADSALTGEETRSQLVQALAATTRFIGIVVGSIIDLERLSPDELVVFSMFIVLLTSIGFGIISSRWMPSVFFWQRQDWLSGQWVSGELSDPDFVATSAPNAPTETTSGHNAAPIQVRATTTVDEQPTAVQRMGLPVAVFGFALIVIVMAQIISFGLDTVPLQAVWVAGLGLLILGAILMGRGPTANALSRGRVQPYNLVSSGRVLLNDGRSRVDISPTGAWRWILAILIGSAFLYLLQLANLPAKLEPVIAETGLQALAILRGEAEALFFPGATGLPMLAYIPAALGIQLSGHPLIGVRLAGVGAGLLMVLATWLLACELFRRVPRYGRFGTLLEDDGRWIAILAALIVATSHVTLYFSRIPIYLAPIAWGSLGLWALLRGLRQQSLFSLVISGMMIGFASVLHTGGLFYLLVAPLWWIGAWLLQRPWVGGVHGVQVKGLIVWLSGIGAVMLPFWGVWLRLPLSYAAYLQGNLTSPAALDARQQAILMTRGVEYLFFDNLRLTLFTFNVYPNNGMLFTPGDSMVNSWLAPLLFLGIGALFLNLDRLVGWLLIVTFGIGLVLASVSLEAPLWLRLLPLLPLLAMIIAFALDRIRVLLLETAGVWLEQTTVYVALGLVIWAGCQGWFQYYNYALRQDAGSSHIGRAIHSMAPEQAALLLFSDPPTNGRIEGEPSDSMTDQQADQDTASVDSAPETTLPTLVEQRGFDPTVINFISSDLGGPRPQEERLVRTWPLTEEILSPTRLLIQPENQSWLQELETEYGSQFTTTLRNLRGDPVLYLFDIWPAQQ